jgi:hypothetical protein
LPRRMASLGSCQWAKRLSKKGPRSNKDHNSSRRSRAQVEWGAVGHLVRRCAIGFSFYPVCSSSSRIASNSGWSCPSLCAALLFCNHRSVALRFLRHTLRPPFFYPTIGYLPRHTTHSPCKPSLRLHSLSPYTSYTLSTCILPVLLLPHVLLFGHLLMPFPS